MDISDKHEQEIRKLRHRKWVLNFVTICIAFAINVMYFYYYVKGCKPKYQ